MEIPTAPVNESLKVIKKLKVEELNSLAIIAQTRLD